MADFRNNFSWSMSRHKILEACPRAYYYRHYGSWGGWDPEADPRTREIYILKKLSNRFTLAGTVVHEVVAEVLNKHRYGREVELAEAQEQALGLLRQGFRESRDGAYHRRKAVGLFEHEYALNLPDEEWVRMRDRVTTCIGNFYASRIRTTILETDIENWLPIDTLDSFEFEGTTVYVAPDFALRNPRGNALVIDWKTGRPGDHADRMQVVCYGLFAREKWGINPRRAIGELHYLLTMMEVIVTLDEPALAEGVDHIHASIAHMRALLDDPEQNTASEDRFPRTEDRSLCATCNFRRVCWPRWPETE